MTLKLEPLSEDEAAGAGLDERERQLQQRVLEGAPAGAAASAGRKVTLPPPSDRELLRSIYRRLDLKGLLADHPGLTREDVVDLFRRLSAPPEPRGKIAPARRAAAAAPDEKGARRRSRGG